MVQQVRTLVRDNLSELESVERLVASIGSAASEAAVRFVSSLHTVDTESAIQSINRLTHPSLIGMSETPFRIFQRLCDKLVVRAPALLQRPSYRCRNANNTAVPFELWLAIVRHAREFFDPAGLDADFWSRGCGREVRAGRPSMPLLRRSGPSDGRHRHQAICAVRSPGMPVKSANASSML